MLRKEQSDVSIYLASKGADYFPAVKGLAEKLLNLFADKQAAIENLLQNDTRGFDSLKNSLYLKSNSEGKYLAGPLGAMPSYLRKESINDVLADIKGYLRDFVAGDEKRIIMNVMPIFAVVGYRIIRPLYQQEYNRLNANQKSVSDLISISKKYRQTIADREITPIRSLGLVADEQELKSGDAVLDAMTTISQALQTTMHRNSLQRYTFDEGVYTEDKLSPLLENNTMIAGPSNHMLTLWIVANLIEPGILAKSFNEISIAYQSYLTSAGYHSADECRFVVNQLVPDLCFSKNMQDYLPKNIVEDLNNKSILPAEKSNAVNKKSNLWFNEGTLKGRHTHQGRVPEVTNDSNPTVKPF